MIAESTDELNRQIPRLAHEAFTQAFENAKASGRPFLASIDGYLSEVLPDGSHRKIRKLPPNVPIKGKKTFKL